MKQLLFHGGFLIFYAASWFRLQQSLKEAPLIDPKLKILQKLRGRFLTNWNFCMQITFLVLCVFHDVARLLNFFANQRNKFKKRLDFFFYSFLGPTSFFVCIAFWSIYSIDRRLIFPPILDRVIPRWVNHAHHSFVAVVVGAQMIFNKQSSPKLRNIMYAQMTLNGLYLVCIYETYFETNLWIYPFLGAFPEPIRIVVIVFLIGISLLNAVGFYYINEFVYGTVKEPIINPYIDRSDKKKTITKYK